MSKQLDFVAVGPFKTGTSWIYDYLLNYDRVILPTKVKETFFFDNKFDLGLDWYFAHFPSLDETKTIGEIAPSYFHSVAATQRIFDHNPQCKILVTLREPISRIVSYYSHMKQRGRIEPGISLTEALADKKILLETSRYYFHLSRWVEIFGEDNVKVIFFETLQESPEQFAGELSDKLEIELENVDYDLSKKVNASVAPVNHNVSKLVYSGVRFLHNSGLHKIVDYGKKIGIKQILNRNKSKKDKDIFSQDELLNAFNLCKQDILMLESQVGLDISPWKSIWNEKGIKID